MQIPSIPPPIVSNALPQDVVSKAVPNVQATPPLIQNSVAPTPKTEKFNKVRDDRGNPRDRRRDAQRDQAEGAAEDEHSVNIKV